MAIFLKCTHLRYLFRIHEISTGLGLEVLKEVDFRLIGFAYGQIQSRLFDLFQGVGFKKRKRIIICVFISFLRMKTCVERFPYFHLHEEAHKK